MRTQLCADLLTALGDRAPIITPNDLDTALVDWKLIDVGGAVVMVKGAEMHVGALPAARGRWFGAKVRKLLRDTLQEHGRIETVVMRDHHQGHEFAHRMGFEQIGDSGAVTRYELRTLRHALPPRTI